jgi:uncharacterized protein (TIGR02145 family)
MKKIKGSLIVPLIIVGLSLIFTNGCKKSDSSNDNGQPQGQTVTDIDGNVYPVVTIGTQTWMAANLRTTKYRDGTPITLVNDSVQWTELKTAAYCNVNNSEANTATYGRFYNWYAVTNSYNIAPAGWHVPADTDWTILSTYVGSGPGGKLKATGLTYWSSPNSGATNSTGFNGYGAGDRSTNGAFRYFGTYGCFWCTTQSDTANAVEHVLSTNSANLIRMAISKKLGINVRCVKDQAVQK